MKCLKKLGVAIVCCVVSGLLYADVPAALVDTSSKPATVASCVDILNATISNPGSFELMDKAADARSRYQKIEQDLDSSNDPKAHGIMFTAHRQTQAKVQALNAKRDYAPIQNAGKQCISMLR